MSTPSKRCTEEFKAKALNQILVGNGVTAISAGRVCKIFIWKLQSVYEMAGSPGAGNRHGQITPAKMQWTLDEQGNIG